MFYFTKHVSTFLSHHQLQMFDGIFTVYMITLRNYEIKFTLTIWILDYIADKACLRTNSSWNKNKKKNNEINETWKRIKRKKQI